LLSRRQVERTKEERTVCELLELVSLDASILNRYPRELSGGQKQRVAIARAFAPSPAVVLCDEITSALDVSVQATLLNLLRDLADKRGTALVFVSHNLAVVNLLADQCIVMHRGEVVESGETTRLFEQPQHEYSRTLLRSIPDLCVPPQRIAAASGLIDSEGPDQIRYQEPDKAEIKS
jgi:peptide/nickel transport system ATP-binding protein